jgi:hypothetical protein
MIETLPQVTASSDPDDKSAPAIVDYYLQDVRLDFDEAKQFQRELCALINRYRGTQGSQRYAVRLALTPLYEGT